MRRITEPTVLEGVLFSAQNQLTVTGLTCEYAWQVVRDVHTHVSRIYGLPVAGHHDMFSTFHESL